jgi:two-component system, response regulator YesN
MDEPVAILVVDDEHLVRGGIRHLLGAQKEFHVIDEASNGREAVEKAAALQPAIILMDVKMPVMDGLEALEKVRASAPRSRTVILSGYSDFQYAQKALQLGASDYLLKPVDPTQLIAVLRRVKAHLLEERRQSAADTEVRQKLSYSLSAFMEQFYTQLLRGDLTAEEVDEKIKVLGLGTQEGAVLLVGLDGTYRLNTELSPEACLELARQVRKLAESSLQEHGIRPAPVIPLDDACAAVIYPSAAELAPVDFARALLGEARRLTGRTISVAVGSFQPLPRLRLSHEEARSRLKQRLLLGGDRVLSKDPAAGGPGGGYPDELEDRLGKALRFGDREQVKTVLVNLLTEVRRSRLPLEAWHQLIFDITELGYRNLRLLGFPAEQCSFPLAKSREIASLETPEDLHLWLQDNLGRIAGLIQEKSTGPSLGVKKALSYIDDHFSESIRLTDVAALVCLSPNYLSQLFTRETGKSFLEHLSRRRIEEAKRLLVQSVLNVSEIAYKVGYDNPRHFSEVFRRLEELTPTQFREGRAGGGPRMLKKRD